MADELWVIIVALEPAEPASREMLELVLAGATLEAGMMVVFTGPGCAHLEPEAFAPWRQLADFELAEMRARLPADSLLPSGVVAIDEAELELLCRDAAGVLEL